MEGKRRITKTFIFRTVLILHVSIVATIYWVIKAKDSPSPMLCTQHHVAYSKADSFSVAGTSENKHFQMVHEIFQSYQRFHKAQRRKVFVGESIQKLTWYCTISDCNGIGDRVKGIYGAFLLALAMNRTFFIHQSDEIQKTMFLEPNAIDWRPVNSCITLHPNQTLDTFGQPSPIQQRVFGVRNDFSLEIERLKSKDDIFISGKRRFLDLLGSINRSEVAVQDQSLHELLQLMLQSGADLDLHYLLSAIHQFLFHIPLEVEKEANLTLKELDLQPRKFVSVHIRTGFMNSFLGEVIFRTDFFKGNRFARKKASWKQMMDCAISFADSKLGNDSIILVSSDDQEPKSWALTEYKSRVKVLDIHPVHVGNKPILGDSASKTSDAFLHNWVELTIMSRSLSIVSIDSGFSEVASHMGSMNPLSLYFYKISESKCLHFTESDWVYHI